MSYQQEVNPYHPISRRAAVDLLRSAEERVKAALERADQPTSRPMAPPPPPRETEFPSGPPAPQTVSYELHPPPPTQLASNEAERPQLFYGVTPELGIGLKHRRDRFRRAAVDPDEAAALGHYGIQSLHDFDRSNLLGPLADYIPSTVQYQHWAEPCARERFDRLLAKVQQAQLQATIQVHNLPRVGHTVARGACERRRRARCRPSAFRPTRRHPRL